MARFYVPAGSETLAVRACEWELSRHCSSTHKNKDGRQDVVERLGDVSEWCVTITSIIRRLAHTCCSSVKSQERGWRGLRYGIPLEWSHQRLHAPHPARSCRSLRKVRTVAGVGKGTVYLPIGVKRAHQRFLSSPTQPI